MKNALVTVEANAALMAEIAAQFPELAMFNNEASQGISAGFPPSIGLNGTRFVVKEGGEETTLNTLTLSCVILRAKPTLDKTFYMGKYTPGQEAMSPDCQSSDGVKPDAGCPNKQADNCAGCPKNQFGTSTDAQGNPGKGKACTDTKKLALYTNNGVYSFKITPASLKAFATYVKQLTARGIALPTCVTQIGFDTNFTYPVLTFDFDGMLPVEQIGKMIALGKGEEASDIIGVRPVALPAPAQFKNNERAVAAPVEAPTFKAKATEVTKPKVEAPIVAANDPSDDDLARELGL